MIINYVPGEECRVAIVEDGKLEELYVERFASANRVGNIYVGRVVNVEPAIQAAFIDFGIGLNGFLHVSDLHPRYFPGEGDDTTERVGHKTPRRERPPIQHALRRGDEVIVQVLKDGVGSKGPTVTSYLSIPGRFLVMMPQMDNIGVSRKVEDDEQRREMRAILDQLELPEGFGFILRTAGFQKTKTELKRDLSYLQRLWKDMERRLKTGGNKPRLLYSESDLLVRSLRDLLTSEISQVIIDHETALTRASRFMKIVAPRGAAKLMHFPSRTPIFHAFNIEEQISLIHAREVPLPSGGRLVIDQTEALVAIDVNSGKSRESRDSETNAYQTNIEAVDEICRQLRLRDMGGIVINDLIDMRRAEHRKDIEQRFKERLKRDRARTTVLNISEFGILEMTRQRMRPSHESVHFSDCPTCRGRGMVQKPESVASEAVRELCMLLDVEKIERVEMVISARVAGEMLSGKRQLLTRIERAYSKKVDVRVSEAVPVDRVGFYAYDNVGNDVDLTNLPRPKKPKDLKPWEEDTGASADWADTSAEQVVHDEPEPIDEAVQDFALHPIEIDDPADEAPQGQGGANDEEGDGGGKRRRRRRGRRGRGSDRPAQPGQPQQAAERQPAPQPQAAEPQQQQQQTEQDGGPGEPLAPGQQGPDGQGGRRRRRRRGRRGRGGRGGEGGAPMDANGAPRNGESNSDGMNGVADDIAGDEVSPAAEEVAADEFALREAHQAPRAPQRPGLRPAANGIITGDHGESEESIVVPPAPVVSEPVHEEQSESDESGPDDGADEGAEAPEGALNADGSPQAEGGEGGEGGRRRRRRRRGRGRGGNRPADGQQPPQGGERPPAQANPPANSPANGGGNQNQGDRPREGRGGPRGQQQGGRGGQDRRERRDDRPREDRPRPENRPAPQQNAPAPQPPPATPGSAKPRTLYGAVKRKLSASELNRRPKPE